jgi:hypothetical protein
MGAISKHPLDVAKWIERVIESATTAEQFEVCHSLIGNYRDTYLKTSSKKNKSFNMSHLVRSHDLMHLLIDKQFKV